MAYLVIASVAAFLGYCVGALMASSRFRGQEMRFLHLTLTLRRFTEKYPSPDDGKGGSVEVSADDLTVLRSFVEDAEES